MKTGELLGFWEGREGAFSDFHLLGSEIRISKMNSLETEPGSMIAKSVNQGSFMVPDRANPQPMDRMWPRRVINAAQQGIVNFLKIKTLLDFFFFFFVT